MKNIYKLGENIIEEVKRYDELGRKQESGIYRVISIESIFNNKGDLTDRNVAITELDTGRTEFWQMILSMMEKQPALKRSSKALQIDLVEKFGIKKDELK